MKIQYLDTNDQIQNLDASSLEALKPLLRGHILTPGTQEYDDGRNIWNDMIDRKPAFIVQCLGTSDVVECTRFAIQHNMVISVKGAGHNIAGRSLKDHVMLIDLSRMNQVLVNPSDQTVYAGPGATLGDIDCETKVYELALPTGINSTTGISGLTLGGGFGWLSRKYGMTIDSLISADVVTPNGQVLKTDEHHHPDLFWGLKGGCGNFGIVTSFKFKLHPLKQELIAGPVIFEAKDAKNVLKQYRDFCQNAPDELSVWAVLRHAPPFPFIDKAHHGKPVLVLVVCYVGDLDEGNKYVEKIKSFAKPLGSGAGPHLFHQFQQAFDPLLTPGARNYWKTHNLKALEDPFIDILSDSLTKLPTMESEIFIAQMGGQTNRIAADATAYPHRDVHFILNVHTRWVSEKDDKRCMDWARDFYKATLPYASGGGYINFISEGDDSTEIAYGDNVDKLAKIKAQYDPQNLMRANLNIIPKS